jgi:hypothetical protein
MLADDAIKILETSEVKTINNTYITSECFDDKHVERKTNFQNEYCLINIELAFSIVGI